MVLETTLRDVDPRFAITNYDVKLSRLIAPGLTTVDSQDLEPRLHIAESLDRIDDRHWRVTIKPGLLFSDGTPLKASDVAFTYSSVLAKSTKSLYRKSFAERFSEVKVVAERQVEFVLHTPIATLRSDLDFGILSESAAGEGRVVGVGPFALQSFSAEKVVLVRNEHYRLGPVAKMARIVVKTVRDGNARNLMLVGGSADFSQNAVRVDLVEFIEKRERVVVLSDESAILTYLMMHNEDPLLSDVRVREAIAHAINRQDIIDGAMFGSGTPIGTHFAPHNPDYVDLTGLSNYDPDKSRALLKEAGAEGITLRLMLPPPSYARRGGEVIAAQLREVGIETEISNLEWAQWLEQVFKGKDFDLTIVSHTEPRDINIYARPDYYFQYDNADFQALMDELAVTSDPAKRTELNQKAQRMIAEDYVNGYLFQLGKTVVANAKVQGLWANAPTQANDLTGVSWAD